MKNPMVPPMGCVVVALANGQMEEHVASGGLVRVLPTGMLQVNFSNGPSADYAQGEWLLAVWRSRSNRVRVFGKR